MATRELRVSFTGDTKDLDRAFQKVDRGLKKTSDQADRSGGKIHGFATITSKGFSRVGVAATGMATAGAGAAGLLAKSFISGASDINESLTKNQVLFGKYARGVDEFSKRSAGALGVSRAAALEAVGTFGNLFNALDVAPQKSARLSTSLVKLAADMASFNNASPEETLEAIRSGLVGETEPLRRFGVNINDAQLRQQALQMGLVKTTKEVLPANAKALASVALITKQTSAAHGDFARTSGGLANQQRILKARLSDAGAELGGKLMPAALGALKGLNSLFNSSSKGGKVIASLGRAFGAAADWMKGAWQTAVAAVGRFVARNREDIQSVAKATRNVGIAIRTVVTDVIIPAVKILAPAVGGALQGIVTVMRGVIRVFSGVLTGNWKKAWQGFKDIVSGSIRAIGSLMKGLDDVLAAGAKAAGKAIVRGILAGMGQLGHLITKKITDSIGFAAGVLGDPGGLLSGIGKKIGNAISGGIGDGSGFSVGAPGVGGGALMGADADLAPFASLGASMGLRTSSGLRPGAHTISGGLSYHATGDAIDEFGPLSRMRRYASTLFHSAGSRLRELISPFPEFGIKDGRPFRYSGAVQAQHSGSNAHVHVAYTGPFGDGLGNVSGRVSTFGPPLEAAGTTASGVSSAAPGIALFQRGTLGKLFRVRIGGHSAVLRQTDIGPAPWTGRKIDVTGAGARKLGFNPAHFPTDARGSATLATNRSGKRAGASRPGLSASSGGSAGVVGGSGGTGMGFGALVGFGGLGVATPGGFGSAAGSMFTPDPDFSLPTQLDYLDAATAQAQLTPGTADDLTAAQNAQAYYQGTYQQALGTKDPRIIGPAAEALKQAMDVVAALQESIDAANRIAEERAQVEREVRDNQNTLIRLAQTQGPQLVAGLTAIMSGGIAGRAGLGFQTPGFAGFAGSVRY